MAVNVSENTLDRLIETERQNRLYPAWLFWGVQEAVYQSARRWVTYLLCLEKQSGKPCGHCKSCRVSDPSQHPDILLLGDEQENIAGIDEIRASASFIFQPPHYAPYKVVILYQVDNYSVNAQNALLKILEESPGRVHFLLLTRDKRGVLPTVLSRCLAYPIGPVSGAAMLKKDWQETLSQKEKEALIQRFILSQSTEPKVELHAICQQQAKEALYFIYFAWCDVIYYKVCEKAEQLYSLEVEQLKKISDRISFNDCLDGLHEIEQAIELITTAPGLNKLLLFQALYTRGIKNGERSKHERLRG